jgi:hypothetical protein
MKTFFVLASILAVLTANAQPPPAEGSVEARQASRLGTATSRTSQAAKSNEVVKGNVIYSGIVVELLKAGSPLKLVNPSAPANYPPPGRDYTRTWASGPADGFTLFGIRF